jgi:hypothetical protein
MFNHLFPPVVKTQNSPRASDLPVDKHARQTKREPEDGSYDAHEAEGRAAFVALLDTDHLGMIRRQQGGDALLSHRVDIVVDCDTRGGRRGRPWHVNEGCAMDGRHERRLWLVMLRRLRDRVLGVLWVVRST